MAGVGLPRGRRFTFGAFRLDVDRSTVDFPYHVDLPNGQRVTYTDRLAMPHVSPVMWERIPVSARTAVLRAIGLSQGTPYWKLHLAPEQVIEDFALTAEQAAFWDDVYTEGMGEFFFRAQVDYRGLVAFPRDPAATATAAPIPLSLNSLVMNGGGKDSVVSAQLLKQSLIPFDLFTISPRFGQHNVAGWVGRRLVTAIRNRDPVALSYWGTVTPGNPLGVGKTFIAVLAAILHDYRFVVMSNERSSDEPNTEYLGLPVNHQWCKTTKVEAQIRRYVKQAITPDVDVFSLVRPFTEIELVRRFAAYKKYYRAFVSCNVNFAHNFKIPEEAKRPGHAYWCNKCAKCAFIFGALSAFVSRDELIDIFGANLYADASLVPMFRRLLGIEGIKPFECVGSAEEMIVAMSRAHAMQAYNSDPAMKMFEEHRSSFAARGSLEAMEQRVFARDESVVLPPRFTNVYDVVAGAPNG